MDHRITYGMEIEFYLREVPYDIPRLLIEHGFHRDYADTYEVSTKPYDLDNYKEFRREYLELKKQIERIGGYLCAEYSNTERTWTNGSHIHIRIEPVRPVIWARALNWLTILAALLAPAQCNCVRIYDLGDKIIASDYCGEKIYAFRYRVQHFATPPKRVNWLLMSELLRTKRFRSLYPYAESNDFYGVEINAYRKDVHTIEIRTNENGWKVAVMFADLVNMLKDINSPPIDPVMLWNTYVRGGPTRIDRQIVVFLKNHPLTSYLPKALGGGTIVAPDIFANALLQFAEDRKYDLLPPTKELLKILASGRRIKFSETI